MKTLLKYAVLILVLLLSTEATQVRARTKNSVLTITLCYGNTGS